MPFTFTPLGIRDVVLIEPRSFPDDRGYFMETFKASDFAAAGIPASFPQDNHSLSRKGVLRGLHFQKHPKAQGKLVRVVAGEIFDVAVDIRRGSPWYGRWVAERLSAENRRMLWLPAGFAHGFLALADHTEVLYKASDEYAPDVDRGIVWNDPDIAIDWPADDVALSPKDAGLPFLRDADNNFVYEE